jgi:hypothetical protein
MHLALRIVRATSAQRSGAETLGDAMVGTGTASGVLATVYLDRVERLAAVAQVRAADLLGHAIAHEIGHLLLGSTTHSATGLMRAVWSRDEIRRARQEDWTFANRDIVAIREGSRIKRHESTVASTAR